MTIVWMSNSMILYVFCSVDKKMSSVWKKRINEYSKKTWISINDWWEHDSFLCFFHAIKIQLLSENSAKSWIRRFKEINLHCPLVRFFGIACCKVARENNFQEKQMLLYKFPYFISLKVWNIYILIFIHAEHMLNIVFRRSKGWNFDIIVHVCM